MGNMTGDQPLLMTTTGSFHTDSNGVLKTETGLVLLGWPAGADGSIDSYPRDTISGVGACADQRQPIRRRPNDRG